MNQNKLVSSQCAAFNLCCISAETIVTYIQLKAQITLINLRLVEKIVIMNQLQHLLSSPLETLPQKQMY